MVSSSVNLALYNPWLVLTDDELAEGVKADLLRDPDIEDPQDQTSGLPSWDPTKSGTRPISHEWDAMTDPEIRACFRACLLDDSP